MAALMSFSSNISYLAEVHFGCSAPTCSLIMLAYGGLNFLGLVLCRGRGEMNDLAKQSVSYYAMGGVLFFALSFTQQLWAYLLGCALQAFFGPSNPVYARRHASRPVSYLFHSRDSGLLQSLRYIFLRILFS